MFNPDHLHIALASDTNYAEFVAVVLASLFDTNHFDRTTVHLLSNGIDATTLDHLRRHIPPERGELRVYDIGTLADDLGIAVPPTIAITSYARLFLPRLLPDEVERVIYVDCDTVVGGDITEFYTAAVSDDHWVAGALDTMPTPAAKIAVGLSKDEEYLNAGVLLFNLRAWRECDLTRRCLDFLLEHGGRVFHHDQGIINAVCRGHKLVVHPRYNAATAYFSHPYSLLREQNTPFYSEREVAEATARPAIVHFTEGFFNRPWVQGSRHPLRDTFLRYQSMTEWAGTPLRPDRRSPAARTLAWAFLHLPLWAYNLVSRTLGALSRLKH